MIKYFVLLLPLTLVGTGCTAASLARHTVNQSQSAADYRYQATMHALAMVAANPGTVPSYALLSNGVTSITNSGVANSLTLWKGTPFAFASDSLAFTGTHTPMISWTVSPVADFTQLEAMRCACRWVLGGPERLTPDEMHLLADPETDPSPGPHFGVLDRLSKLPRGWMRVGGLRDMAAGSHYRDHCGGTWVSVAPDGMEGLADFTLVLQDIATLDVTPSDGSVPASHAPPLLVTLWLLEQTLPPPSSSPVSPIHGNISAKGKVTNGDSLSIDGTFVVQVTDIKPLPPTSPSPHANCPPSPSTSTPQDYSAFYSPNLVFRFDRVIRPECKCEIERRLGQRLWSGQPVCSVGIGWEEWMCWTTPYQGVRGSVKPGTATTKQLPQPPPTRQLSSMSLLQSLRIVPLKSGNVLPIPSPKPMETLPTPGPALPK